MIVLFVRGAGVLWQSKQFKTTLSVFVPLVPALLPLLLYGAASLVAAGKSLFNGAVSGWYDELVLANWARVFIRPPAAAAPFATV